MLQVPMKNMCLFFPLQPTSCLLDGSCYKAADPNPSDQCLICDPFSNQWRYKACKLKFRCALFMDFHSQQK